MSGTATALVGMVLYPFRDDLTELKGWAYGQINPPKQAEFQVDLIRDLLGPRSGFLTFFPGANHYRFPGKFHPDDEFAHGIFKAATSPLAQAGITISNRRNFADWRTVNGSIALAGSPVSNLVSRQIMGYSHVSLREPEAGMRKVPNRFFGFPFEYLIERDRLIKLGGPFAHYQVVKGEREYQVPNWTIFDKLKGKPLPPEIDAGGNVVRDHLLITCVPNLGNSFAWEAGERIVLFGGTHGAGTRGVDLLFRDRGALQQLVAGTRNLPAWQALLSVSAMTRVKDRGTGTQRTHPTVLDRKIAIAAVSMNRRAIETSFARQR